MAPAAQPTGSRMLCVELCRSYISHAHRVYRRPDGTPTRTPANIEIALRPILTCYADVSAERFHSSHLRAIRASWVDAGLTRTTINDRSRVIVAMFTWAAELGYVADSVVAHLRVVRPLRRGMAAEGRGVIPVSAGVVAATLVCMPPAIADMCRFMMLTGARVGEAREARSDELHVVEQPSLSLWVLRPRWHKTARHGCSRSLVLNREAQRFIQSRLGRTYLFGPDEGDRPYHPAAVTVAIYRACDRAGVKRWSPGQIRHTVATTVYERLGLDSARLLLGHTTTRVTHRYIHSHDEGACAEIVGVLSCSQISMEASSDEPGCEARAG